MPDDAAPFATAGGLEDNAHRLNTDISAFKRTRCRYSHKEYKQDEKLFLQRRAVRGRLHERRPRSATELETDAQKLGYIIGMDIGGSLKQQGADLDLDSLIDAIRATYNGEPLAMTPEEAATIREEFIAKRRAEAETERQSLAAANAAEGDKFLLENRVKEGVVVTDSGLQYKVVEMGDGAKPAATDNVTVNYRGTLLNGEEFDSSYARNQPVTFQLDQVIPGLDRGCSVDACRQQVHVLHSAESGLWPGRWWPHRAQCDADLRGRVARHRIKQTGIESDADFYRW